MNTSVVIPDAEVSDAKTESEDDADSTNSRPQVDSDSGSEWSSDEELPLKQLERGVTDKYNDDDNDDIPLTQLQQQKTPNRKKIDFCWHNMNLQ